jgi:hypothetical protein
MSLRTALLVLLTALVWTWLVVRPAPVQIVGPVHVIPHERAAHVG